MKTFFNEFTEYCRTPGVEDSNKAKSYSKAIEYLCDYLKITMIDSQAVERIKSVEGYISDKNSAFYKELLAFLTERKQKSYLDNGFVRAALKPFFEFVAKKTPNIKENFRKWFGMQHQKNNSSLMYSDSTIDAAVRLLESGMPKLGLTKYSKLNCFDITDYSEFKIVRDECYSVAEDFDKKQNHGDFRNGLDFYLWFLKELAQFKELVEIFVRQLKINNDILDGEKIYGQGYRDMPKIQSIYKHCREFDGYILELNLQAGYNAYNSSNYINLRETWINVVPIFQEVSGGRHDVTALQVVIKPDNKVISNYPSETIDKLGLFDGQAPNEVFASFFVDFRNEIYKYSKIAPGHFDSWEIVDEVTAIKTCDKSFFDYNGSGVPKGICWFFGAEELETSENKSISLVYNGVTYDAKVQNDSTDRRRVRIFWNSELGKLFSKYKDDNVKVKFTKTADLVYEIEIIGGEEDMASIVLDNIIKAMKQIGGKGSYAEIYTAYEKIADETLTDGKKAGIRGTIERNSSDSDVFSGNDIFYSVEGKGKGVWGLRNYVSTNIPTVKEQIDAIESYIAAKGFNYDGNLVENFYLSLKSKPFVILAGTSGTGKTRLVRLFAEAIGAEYNLVSVRPDWSDSSDLFGHVDLNQKFVKGDIIDFVKQAELNPAKPYILCLDEMNLARVEYYMSDILSTIETRRFENGQIITDAVIPSSIYGNDTAAAGRYGKVMLPGNLYIVGTVNMDETTFPFSKKVLDRANTIEFSYVDLLALPSFEKHTAQKQTLTNDFLISEYITLNDCDATDREYIEGICTKLQRINTILESANAHIGYRVRDEIVFYMLNNKKAELLEENVAFDNQIMQKILPRIQGSSDSIKKMLDELLKLCESEKYDASTKKINFMIKRYEEDGFTSYWL